MWPRRIGCSHVPRTRRFASACSCAPGHSIRASGADTASTSNCKLRKYGELVVGLAMPSFADTSIPATSNPCVRVTRSMVTFPESRPASGVPVSLNEPPTSQLMPSGFRGHIFQEQARRIENHVARDGAKPGWKIRRARGGIFDVHASSDAGPVQRAFKGSVDLRWTAGVEIGHKTADQPQVQCAIQAQSDRPAPCKLNRSGDL